MKVLSLFSLALLVIFLAGCTTIQNKKVANLFEQHTDTYRKFMRWSYYEQAAEYYRHQDDEDAKPPNLVDLKKFRITQYNVSEKLISEAGTEAKVIVNIDFYELDSGVVKSFRDVQLWWYDSEAKRWYLGSDMPDFQAIHQRQR